MQSRTLVFLLALMTSLSFHGFSFSILEHGSNCTLAQNPNFCNGGTVLSGNSSSVSCNESSIVIRSPQNPASAAALFCRNCASLKTAKFIGGCDPDNSRGFRSSQACKGKSYLCVLDGRATCYIGSNAIANLGASYGECFI